MAYNAQKNENGTIKINRKRRPDTSPDSERQPKRAHVVAEPEEGEVDDPSSPTASGKDGASASKSVPFPFKMKEKRLNPGLNVFSDKEKEIKGEQEVKHKDSERGKGMEVDEGDATGRLIYERPPEVSQEIIQRYGADDPARSKNDRITRDSRRHHDDHRDRDRSPRPTRDFRHSSRYYPARTRNRSPSPEISANFSPVHHTYDLRDGRERERFNAADCYRPGESQYPSHYDADAYSNNRGYDSYRPGGTDRGREYDRDHDRDRDRDYPDREQSRGYDRYVPSSDSRRDSSPTHSHRPVSPDDSTHYRPVSPSYRPRSPQESSARPKSPHTPPLPSQPPPEPPSEPPPPPPPGPRASVSLPPKPQNSLPHKPSQRDSRPWNQQRPPYNANQRQQGPPANGDLPPKPAASWHPPQHAQDNRPPPPEAGPPPNEPQPQNQQEPPPKPRIPLPRKTVTMRSKKDEAMAYGGKTFSGVASMDDYELMKKVGEGTFGEVHKATHKETGAQVALKRILMHNEREGMPITALREVKILKAIRHASIIELRDIIVTRSTEEDPLCIYMVFPYMDHDLAGLLENERVKLQPSHVKLYMKQLVSGTDYMHRNKVLHRDMKAANLLISNDGTLKIADFGLARCWDGQSAGAGCSVSSRWSGYARKRKERESNGAEKGLTNCVVTRWYRPPELLLGARNYGGEVDMWGIGCVLAEMFMRKPIFPGSSDLDQLDRIFSQCGTPTQVDWPNYDSLPGCEGITRRLWGPFPSGYVRKIKNIYMDLGVETTDLLDKLLALNPATRITAAEALDHNYFWSDPMPADPKTLPSYEASHEFDKRGPQIQAAARHHEQQRQQAPQQQQQQQRQQPPQQRQQPPQPRQHVNQRPNDNQQGAGGNNFRPRGPPAGPSNVRAPPPNHMGGQQRMPPPSHPQMPQQNYMQGHHGQHPPPMHYGAPPPHHQGPPAGYGHQPQPPMHFRGPPPQFNNQQRQQQQRQQQQQQQQQQWRNKPNPNYGGNPPSNGLPPRPTSLPNKPAQAPPPPRPPGQNGPALFYG